MTRKTQSLGVACALGHMSYNQASSVLYFQEQYQWFWGKHVRALELAVELGYLAKQLIIPILKKLAEWKKNGDTCPDPANESAWGGGRARAITVRAGSIAAATVLVTSFVAVATLRLDIAAIAVFVGLVATNVNAVAELVNREKNIELRFKSAASSLVLGLTILALFFCAYQGYYLGEIAAGSARFADAGFAGPQWLVAVSGMRLVLGEAGVATCFVCYLVNIRLRRHAIVAHETRAAKLGAIVARVKSLGANRSHAGERERLQVQQDLDKVLALIAEILSANLWSSLTSRFLGVFGKEASKAISVWYLELNSHETHFNIRSFSTWGVPDEATGVYRNIRDKHHPVRMDPITYARVRDECKAEAKKTGRDWTKVMLSTIDRHKYVSVTGYSFERRAELFRNNADDCCVFDRQYRDTLDPEYQDEYFQTWIDFRSLLAFPILTVRDNSACPIGVLLAFRNIRNGFSRDDYAGVCTASRILGLALSAPDGPQSMGTIDGEKTRS